VKDGMPSHQDRRDPLPPGYQFGDAGSSAAMSALDDSDGSRVIARTRCAFDGRVLWQWRPRHERVAERLTRTSEPE
jgi:hypothetical protein